MSQVRAALFLDFDNVFSGLHRIDPAAAMEFAEHPGAWLAALQDMFTVEGPRRWLVLRCYMNPAGWVSSDNGAQSRLYYSRFRPAYTQAGFEVIDCPRLTYTKNAADIRLVLDAVDAANATPAYDEFVIASGDSDMTPLLVRLRAADRRTTILSPSDAADAFTSVADRLIGADDVLSLIQGDSDDEPVIIERLPTDDERAGGDGGGHGALGRAQVVVLDRYANAREPLNLSALAAEIHNELALTDHSSTVGEARWFGAGSFSQFLAGLGLPHMKVSQHFLWDASRHKAPVDRVSGKDGTPGPVGRLTAAFKLPQLAQETWSRIYDALAEYAATHEFQLSEATKWGRDRLAEQDIAVSRQAVGIVTRATAFGGAPLHADPAPTAEEIGQAVVANLVKRAAAAEIDLDQADADVVRAWFGWSRAAV